MNSRIVARIGASVQRLLRLRNRPDANRVTSAPLSAGFLLHHGLVALDCPDDDRCHLVDDLHHTATLTLDAVPRFVSLCGRRLTPPSLYAEPMPLCRSCGELLRRRSLR